jgi:hypothetical protein
MVIPKNTSNVLINSERGHPVADYFSIQIYDGSDLVNSLYHFNDYDLLTNDGLTHLLAGFNLVVPLDNNHTYFFLFRIYGSRLPSENLNENIQFWSGFPPETYIDDRYVPICDIDYNQQGNSYSSTNPDALADGDAMGRGTGVFLDVYNQSVGTSVDVVERKNEIKINKYQPNKPYNVRGEV